MIAAVQEVAEFEKHIKDKSGKYPYDVYYLILPNGYEHGQKDASYMWVHAKPASNFELDLLSISGI